MIVFKERKWLTLLVSVLVISVAFTMQKMSLFFFLKCFSIVVVSYLPHEFFHWFVSSREGIDSRCRIWPLGLVFTFVSGVLSSGMAVLALPTVIKIKERGSSRWMREKIELSVREVGLASIPGPLANLVLATCFLILYNFYTVSILRLAALINLWMALANLIPVPPIDGSKIMSWDRRVWLFCVVVGIVGMLGLFI